jgi:hypothetical protein
LAGVLRVVAHVLWVVIRMLRPAARVLRLGRLHVPVAPTLTTVSLQLRPLAGRPAALARLLLSVRPARGPRMAPMPSHAHRSTRFAGSLRRSNSSRARQPDVRVKPRRVGRTQQSRRELQQHQAGDECTAQARRASPSNLPPHASLMVGGLSASPLTPGPAHRFGPGLHLARSSAARRRQFAHPAILSHR